jgi:hypothetical protein
MDPSIIRTRKEPVNIGPYSTGHLRKPVWQRVALLCILGYEGAGCLLGGGLLVAEPGGSLMDMRVETMHGVFRDFMIPGIILFGLGILNTAAFVTVLRRKHSAWIASGLALGGLLTWFWVEIAILQELRWLQVVWGAPVLLGAILAIGLFSTRNSMVKAALACGILSSLLYLVINIIVPAQYPGYSCASRVVSELSAVGAPTKMLWSVLVTPYTILMLFFA